MEMLGHLGIFIIAAAVIVLIWLAYVTLNSVVDKITNPQIRELTGGLSTVLLFAGIGIVIYMTDISFFMGLVIAVFLWFLFFMGRKMFRVASAKLS